MIEVILMETFNWILPMDFPNRIVKLRKEQGFTQQSLADKISLHVSQIKRYESGVAQPTLETLVRIANALHVSLDELVFSEDEFDLDDKMKKLFMAVEQLSDNEQAIIREVIDGMIIKYEVRRLASATH